MATTEGNCIVCQDPADGKITGTIGDKSGAICGDCAYWCDGNVSPRRRAQRNAEILAQHSIPCCSIGEMVFGRMDFTGPNGGGYEISEVSHWTKQQVLEWLGY